MQEALVSPDRRVIEDLKPYMAVALPSVIMIALDWWAWELLILIGGWLGVPE
jgi:hypothetical protein